MVVGDQFRIRRVAGEGGMGVVYQAEDVYSGKTAAIKVMNSRSPEDRARFLREAQVLLTMTHPSIVRCLRHGELPTGESWMAMEWVEGEDLASRLDRGPLTTQEALLVARSITAALGAAHARGVVHRDVKPGNIILENGDAARARLIDFGVARVSDAGTVTEFGAVLGTPAYMAPEQIRGASEADDRADLYAVGAILFECLTGRLPFVSASMIGLMTQALFEPAPRLRDINSSFSSALDALVQALLEKDPIRRLGPASALLEALDAPDLDRHATHPPTPPQTARLTGDELRFVSVVYISRQTLYPVSTTNATLADKTEGQLLRAIERIATPLHGRVEGLLDGTVLVAFPARGAATDQAAMAARTALAIRDLGAGFPIALATGRASGTFGSLYSDAATRAASLTKLCISEEASIAIDETTRGLLDTRFSVEQRNGAFFLLSEDPFGEAARLLCGRPAPFVGREREVLMIEQIFEDVVNEPQGGAAILVGEAGVGKSRLGREILATLSRIEPTTEIWVARGEAVRAGASFGMLASAIQRAANIREGDPVEVRQQKLISFVHERVRAQDAPSVITFMGEIAEARSAGDAENDELRAARRDPMLMRDRIQAAFEDLVESVTEERPLVLLLEDLHWGDVPTVKILDLAYRALRARPFFVLALGRPEMLEQFPHLMSSWSPSTLRLAGLSRRASQLLIQRILGAQAENEMIASIVDRSAGHPLFLEELVRAVAESASSGTNSLPETVLAMVQSRVAKLPAEARRVLRAASIFGEVFWHEGVAMLLGSTDIANDVENWLRMLREQELVEPKRTSRFPTQQEYGFRHALFREAAYAMLTDADRTTGHLLAATFLEEHGETGAPLLATHFDLARAPLRAAPYHARAAQEALLGGDLDAVLRHADRILDSGIRDYLGEALFLKADAMQWRGAYEQAGQLAEQAMGNLERGSPVWFKAVSTLAMVLVRRIQLDKLREVCTLLADWGTQNAWTDAYVEAAIRTGMQAFIGGQYQIAQALIGPMTKLAESNQIQDPRTLALFEILAAGQSAVDWRYDETIRHAVEAGRLFEQVGDRRTAAGQRLDAVFTLIDMGQTARAIEFCNEIIAIATHFGIARLHSIATGMLGSALLVQGHVDEALTVLNEAKTLLDATGDRRNGGSVRYKIGRCYRLKKEFAQAEAIFNEAGTMLEGLPRTRAMLHANKAFLFIDQGQASAALEQATKGMELFQQLGRIGTDEILVRYAYIESLRLNGQHELAAQELATAKERVHWMANNLLDETIKHSFLTNVEENRRVLEMT